MDGRLRADRVYLPHLTWRGTARKPLHAAAGVGVGRAPIGPQGEIDFAVAVDVVRRDADVVRLRLALDQRVPLPGWVLVPDHTLRIDDHDVGPAIVVHIENADRVAYAEAGFDLLDAEVGRGGREDGSEGEEEDQGQAGHGCDGVTG